MALFQNEVFQRSANPAVSLYFHGWGGRHTDWFSFPLIMLRLKGLIKELFMFLYL